MNFTQIKELISIIENSSITNFELQFENSFIQINKGDLPDIYEKGNNTIKENKVTSDKFETILNNGNPITIIPEPIVEEKEGVIIESPLVGTFYSSNDSNKQPFVSVGSKVRKDDVLCIIEAMKIMNEITSSCDGTVVEVFLEDGDTVEYGQSLFRIV